MKAEAILLRLIVIAALALPGSDARSRHKSRGSGQPGVFDYYVLSLSWSPEHCASLAGARDTVQCAEERRYGFVVHGLWPQYERGFPESCDAPSPVTPANSQRMLPLMPSRQLIQHEWQTHGTCSGLDQITYFDTIQRARGGLRVPAGYTAPVQEINVSPVDVKRKFVAANPGFGEDSVRVLCSGRFLSEVRVCLSKELKPRSCGADLRDTCRVDPVIMRPVR
jgi:ribonuclease T2